MLHWLLLRAIALPARLPARLSACLHALHRLQKGDQQEDIDLMEADAAQPRVRSFVSGSGWTVVGTDWTSYNWYGAATAMAVLQAVSVKRAHCTASHALSPSLCS